MKGVMDANESPLSRQRTVSHSGSPRTWKTAVSDGSPSPVVAKRSASTAAAAIAATQPGNFSSGISDHSSPGARVETSIPNL